MENYDSRLDTRTHIALVQDFLGKCIRELTLRMRDHDLSKLESPEKEMFDKFTPKLKNSTYNSEEYKGFLAAINEELKHHYAKNSHHPEHYENGIGGMCLFDLLEMICDWYSATKRHANGNIMKSIKDNQKRFNYSDDLKQIFENTVKKLDSIQ